MAFHWTQQSVLGLRRAFDDFISYIRIDSKETGGESALVPYLAQRMFIDQIFGGLANGIHDFTCCKGRQLGISTICLLLDVFWASFFSGLRGAIVTDTDANREDFKETVARYFSCLPSSHRPAIERHNRQMLTLSNGSRISYLVAGTRKSVATGGLGRSKGLNFLHATECSSYADEEGMASLKASLAQTFPARLFIKESTARGYNLFYDMCEEALEDHMLQKLIFVSWWAKEIYRIPKGSDLFERFGTAPLSANEKTAAEEVKRLYGISISMEQWAWHRHELDPKRTAEERGEVGSGESLQQQEHPTTLEEAFVGSGSTFFPSAEMARLEKTAVGIKFLPYRYDMGEDITTLKISWMYNPTSANLRIYEEPQPDGIYVIAGDPAYGSSDEADRNCAQVIRVYADGWDQVAEFCDHRISAAQFAWVLAHLCGAYGNVRLIYEINGPGEAVHNELKNVEILIRQGYLRPRAEEMGIKGIFNNIKKYYYRRADSLGQPTAVQWKNSANLKAAIMIGLKDRVILQQAKIRSMYCLGEMKRIVQNGISIKAEGRAKDDRVVALAMADRCYIDYERRPLIGQDMTRESQAEKKDASQEKQTNLFMAQIVKDFHERAEMGRRMAEREARRGKRWRW